MVELSIAICDDDMSDLKTMHKMLNDVLFKRNIEYEINTFSCPSDLLKSDKIYQLIFLDVEMGDMSGIEAAEAIHKISPACLLFFVTHHLDYMDRAMNNHAFRFWTKPIKRSRLNYGIDSAIARIKAEKSYIMINIDKKDVKIRQKNIIYIYHCSRITYVVTKECILKTHDSFRSVTNQLTDACFMETHASCFVNMNYVTDYSKSSIVCSYKGKDYNAFISTRKYSAFNRRFKEWSCELE